MLLLRDRLGGLQLNSHQVIAFLLAEPAGGRGKRSYHPFRSFTPLLFSQPMAKHFPPVGEPRGPCLPQRGEVRLLFQPSSSDLPTKL